MLTSLAIQNKQAQYWWPLLFPSLFMFLLLSLFGLSAQAAYEQALELQAKSILKPKFLKGDNFTVQGIVKNDGLFNHYTVETRFGTFQADSTFALKNLINEINAIADMQMVETDDAAIAALKQSGSNVVAGLGHLVNDPVGTVKGAAAGLGSLFNRAKQTIGKRESSDAEDGTLAQLIGISKSKGKIASRYGVNVYSRNQVLQEQLNRLGQADFLGGLGVGVATSFVPGVGGLVLSTSSAARLLNDAINTTPASELWLQNKNKLIALNIDSDTIELFLNNPNFSPAESTVLVTALDSMKEVENLDLFTLVALQAADPSTASVISKIAVMTAAYHKNIAALKTVTPLARLTQGVRKDGTKVILLPVDHLLWNKRTEEALNREPLKNGIELWVLGTLSKQATTNIEEQGWVVHTHAGARLFPQKKQ